MCADLYFSSKERKRFSWKCLNSIENAQKTAASTSV